MIQQPDEGRAAMDRDTPALPYAATRKALAEAIADIDGLLPGSVVVRHSGVENNDAPARPTRLPRTGPTSNGPAP
jgi:hypothetical protein